jgi:CubicO group peptidase (beta-lactamase class C family)
MRTLSIVLLVMPLAAGGAKTSKPDSNLAAIDRFIRARAEADSFSGAVLVARNGVPMLRAGYGLADREKRVSVTPETKFNLGSIDKLITRIGCSPRSTSAPAMCSTSVGPNTSNGTFSPS